MGEAYGAWGEKTLYGKKSVGVIRSTFLIGPDGTIARPWYHVKADGHAAKVLAETQEVTRPGTEAQCWWAGHHHEVRPPTVDRTSSVPSARASAPGRALLHEVPEVRAAPLGQQGDGPAQLAVEAPHLGGVRDPAGRSGDRRGPPQRSRRRAGSRCPPPVDWSSSRALRGAVDPRRAAARSAGEMVAASGPRPDTSGSRRTPPSRLGIVDHQGATVGEAEREPVPIRVVTPGA